MLIYGNKIFHQQVNRHGAIGRRVVSLCGFTRSLDRIRVRVYKIFGYFKEVTHLPTNLGIFNRHGAGAARRAHNPEVTRSKRVAGNH